MPPAASAHRVTVVVPTFRRPESLERLLHELSRLDEPGVAWDVVVVDNDDPPGIEALVAAATSFPVPIDVVHEARKGASSARNRGIAEAGGSIIAMIDDDVHPAPGWLRALVKPILDGAADATAGRVRLDWRVPRPAWFHREFDLFLAEYEPRSDYGPIPDEAWIVTASSAFRTALLRDVGGLDPVLGPRLGVPIVNDDLDLFRRVRETGARVVFVPDAVVLHDLPPDRLRAGYLMRRLYHQGRSDWLIDRARWGAVRTRGARWGLIEFRRQFGVRRREGFAKPTTRMRAAADVCWLAGFTVEAARSFAGRTPR